MRDTNPELPITRHLCPRCHAVWPRDGACPSDGVELVHDRTGRLLAERFLFRRPLGRGAMGLIWEADQVALHRRVAIKITSASDEETNLRFARGAAIMAQMNHPNIARIHDFGDAPGPTGFELYLVMERLDGAPLSRFINKSPLDPQRAISATAQTLAALDHVHRRGYIHRDVKPANLFVTTLDDDAFVIKLIDFGIARQADRATEAPPTKPLVTPPTTAPTDSHDVREGNRVVRVTQPMRILGTPEYMAPEQVLGHPVDHRADLYAVGVMFYALLAGRLPFVGPDRHSIYAAHLRQDPPRFSDFFVETTPQLARWDSWFFRAFDKSAATRFQSAHEMRSALLDLPALSSTPQLPLALLPPELR